MPLLELLREEVIRNSDLFACRISRGQPELIEGFNSRRPEKQLRRVHPYTIRLSLAQRLLTRPLLCGSVIYSLTRRQLSDHFHHYYPRIERSFNSIYEKKLLGLQLDWILASANPSLVQFAPAQSAQHPTSRQDIDPLVKVS